MTGRRDDRACERLEQDQSELLGERPQPLDIVRDQRDIPGGESS